jgi:hypothetical protein
MWSNSDSLAAVPKGQNNVIKMGDSEFRECGVCVYQWHSRVIFLTAHDGMLSLVALRAQNVEVGYSNFLRLEVVVLLQAVVKFVVALAVQSEIQREMV